MMIAEFVMPEKCRITVNDSKKKNLGWDSGSYILFYTKQKYFDMFRTLCSE